MSAFHRMVPPTITSILMTDFQMKLAQSGPVIHSITCEGRDACWDAGVVMCHGQGADLYMAHLMPLPLTISCSSKSILVLPSWFYLSGVGSPGWSRTKFKRAVKWLCVCVCVVMEENYYNRFTALCILSGTTRVSFHQKGKTNLDLLEQEIVTGTGISWLGHLQVCISHQTHTHASIPSLNVFNRPDALPANQPRV